MSMMILHFHGLTKIEAKTTFHGSVHNFCCLDITFTNSDGAEYTISTFGRAKDQVSLAQIAKAINEVGFGAEGE